MFFLMRLFNRFQRPALIAVAASVLVIAPLRGLAQAQAPASTSSPAAASAPSGGSAATEKPNSEEDQEKAFLHSSAVQSVARVLHLSLDTTVAVFLGINFAVIFLLIVVPLGRTMPKIIRKRSQTLSHDLQTARQATADAEARLSAVEARLAGLGEEIQRFRAQIEQEALEDEKRIKSSIGEESSRIVAAAEQEIGVAVAQAKRGLRNFAADLAIDHASKQIALTPETDRALISEFIAGVSADAAGKGGRS
ncbi:MAG: ATP synthase F0 subunit B [Terracidiphilus sp.]